MAKNIVELNAKCPQCTSKETMIPRVDIKAASNVTVLQCIDCDWEFAKDQSVKIHKKNGFDYVGTLKRVGFKNNHWLDSILMQKIING